MKYIDVFDDALQFHAHIPVSRKSLPLTREGRSDVELSSPHMLPVCYL